ncbi:MAG: hypothetical protein K6E28_02620, partial [Eubacterium sp.]|nr:hypothetical protein [Eubacterium sp.]
MNRNYKKIISFSVVAGMLLSICGCGSNTASVKSDGMKKVGSMDVVAATYTDASDKEEMIESFSSSDGLCVIEKYPTYYDVTLDYEKGEPDAVGKAYAETILEAEPDFMEDFEPYLHENIRNAFDGRKINEAALEERIETMVDSLPQEYKEEVMSFAKTISQGEEGYVEDGKLSYIEALTMQIIPDALRPTACSALSIGGEKTVSGKRISIRNLEWGAGSENQITEIHAVTHMKKGDGSLTSIGFLGVLDIITAVNDDGVMIAILDVGSKDGLPFVYMGKKCYTFEIRYALEHFDNAKDAGEFLVEESGDFTWCNNLLCTDEKDAFCCENATKEVATTGKAKSVLRTTDSELMEGLEWDTPDVLCIVNTFATKGNQDTFTGEEFNMTRFVKYNKWVSEIDKFSMADAKGLLAREVVDQYIVSNVHNSGNIHTVIVDYDTGIIHVSFTKGDCPEDIPRFLEVG